MKNKLKTILLTLCFLLLGTFTVFAEPTDSDIIKVEDLNPADYPEGMGQITIYASYLRDIDARLLLKDLDSTYKFYSVEITKEETTFNIPYGNYMEYGTPKVIDLYDNSVVSSPYIRFRWQYSNSNFGKYYKLSSVNPTATNRDNSDSTDQLELWYHVTNAHSEDVDQIAVNSGDIFSFITMAEYEASLTKEEKESIDDEVNQSLHSVADEQNKKNLTPEQESLYSETLSPEEESSWWAEYESSADERLSREAEELGLDGINYAPDPTETSPIEETTTVATTSEASVDDENIETNKVSSVIIVVGILLAIFAVGGIVVYIKVKKFKKENNL